MNCVNFQMNSNVFDKLCAFLYRVRDLFFHKGLQKYRKNNQKSQEFW